MKRVIKSLNEMSFVLPSKYHLTEDKYHLANGQGFINTENYLSDDGKVISFFEIHRDPDEFLKYYQSLTKKYNEKQDGVELQKTFTLRVAGFVLPVFIIKVCGEKPMYIFQVLVNCGDCMGCFMTSIGKYIDDTKTMIDSNVVLQDLVEILRTVE